MDKKWLFLIPTALLLVCCGVERLSNVISKGTDGMAIPNWDVDFDLPLGVIEAQLSKIDEVNAMLDSLKFTDEESINNNENALIYVKINDMEINDSDFEVDKNVTDAIGSDSVLTWPLPIEKTESPTIEGTSIPTIKLDLDNDNVQDMMLTALKSKDGSLKIKLKMQFEDLNGEVRDAAESDYFDEAGKPYISIVDVDGGNGKSYAMTVGDGFFSFKDGVYDDKNGKLVFETKNFLTDYNEPIMPQNAWAKDENGNFLYEDEEKTIHKLDDVNFEYRISMPEGAFKIRGKSFDIIEDVLGNSSSDSGDASTRSYSVSRSANSRSEPAANKEKLSADEITGRLRNANGDVAVLEDMLNEGVTLEEIAAAYDNNLENMLNDSGMSIADIMKSEVVTSDENLAVLGDTENGFGSYDLAGTTLGEISSENMKSLAEFCKFHDKHAVTSIKFSLEVEVDLGESFVITAEFINDYEVAIDTGDSLPLSKLNKILDNATLEADFSHNFMSGMKLKKPKIGDKEIAISGIDPSEEPGYYTIPEKPCHIKFDLDEMPSEDGGLELALVIPENGKVDIALDPPTKEDDLWINMALGVNGTFKVNVDEISDLFGGE